VVNSIATVPCHDLEINRQNGKTCTEADSSYAIVQADREAGAITVARLLTGEPVGIVLQMLRAVCEIYTFQVWGDDSEAAVERCVSGAR
jgi:hypothetical protein